MVVEEIPNINEIRKVGVGSRDGCYSKIRQVSRRCMKNVQECVVRVRIVIRQGEWGYAVGLPAEGEGDGIILFFSFSGGGFRYVVKTPQG